MFPRRSRGPKTIRYDQQKCTRGPVLQSRVPQFNSGDRLIAPDWYSASSGSLFIQPFHTDRHRSIRWRTGRRRSSVVPPAVPAHPRDLPAGPRDVHHSPLRRGPNRFSTTSGADGVPRRSLWIPASAFLSSRPTRFGSRRSGPVMKSMTAAATPSGRSSAIARAAGRATTSSYGSLTWRVLAEVLERHRHRERHRLELRRRHRCGALPLLVGR